MITLMGVMFWSIRAQLMLSYVLGSQVAHS